MNKPALVGVWLTIVLGMIGCSSDHSGATSTPAQTKTPAGIVVQGTVVDGPVSGATISAYAVGAAGAVSTTALATALSNPDGSYSLTLSAGTTGSILVTSSGGTFKDDVTGATVKAPALSALVPSVSGASITAQLTPLTSIAAQLSLAAASATNPVSTVAAAVTAAIGTQFGGETSVLATPLVDVTTAGCAATAAQASVDASLVIAGLAQLASSNHVNTADLIAAIEADYVSDDVLDGTANGVALTVPLAGGTVLLCTIEGDCPGTAQTGLLRQLGAAIASFQKSSANVCGVAQSTAQQSDFAAAPAAPPSPAPPKYMYSLASTLSGFSGPAGVTATMYVGLLCSDDGGGTTTSSPMHGTLILSASGAFTLVSTANGETDESGYTVGINAPNDCGKNTWTLKLTAPSTLSCSVQGANTGTFITSNGGNTNVAASPPTVSCSPLFTIGGAVTGLTAGAVVLQDNGGDTLTVASGSPSFTFATPLATGATYDVSVETQPAGFNCTVTPSGAQTVGSSNVTTVAVACTPVAVMSSPQSSAVYVIDSTYTLFEFDPSGHLIASVKLPGQAASVGTLNGGGITVDANNVYVTLGAPSTGIAAFTRATLQPVTLGAGAFAGLNTPRGIVFDPANAQFYVANGGSTVTTYDDSGTATGSFLQSGGIYGPSGIAYDATDNALWVANYTGGGSSVSPQYGIADFTAGGSLIANFPTAASPAGTPFAPPNNTGHEMPYWISYCGSSLAVGFISDSSGSGISEAAGYSTAGALLGAGYAGITNLHAMACAPAGNVYVAADNGLLQFNTVSGASVALPSGGFAGLTAPIYGVGVALSGGLNSPEGLAYANGLLYVANSGNNQVQVYKVTTSASSGAVTGMTLSSIITADLNDPVRLALDAGGHLFVANAANNTVTAYDTANGNAEIKAPGGAALISGGSLNRPLGVTVDSVGNLYVANNASDTVSVYKPNTAGSVAAGYTEAAFSPLSADTAGNAFDGPGALTDAVIAGQNYLLLGTGAGGSHVFIYAAPFTGVPAPVYNLSNVTNGMTCSTMPVGPTGIAVYVDPAQPLSSQILVSSLFGNEVADYVASQVIGTSNTCPTPITTAAGSGVSSPEGVAIDSAGQNVFVANSATNTITVYGAGAALNGPAVYTLQN